MVIRKLQIQKLYNGHFLIEYDVLNIYTTFQAFSTVNTNKIKVRNANNPIVYIIIKLTITINRVI